MSFHCFFEQSGTFKNEFKKLGYSAWDYDILNDFNETDFVIDLFDEINVAYCNLTSDRVRDTIFDNISSDDTILAFFPCVRFDNQIIMGFRGTLCQMKDWTQVQKLEYDLKLHSELHYLYCIITKLAIVCLKLHLPLIIENPWSTTHYLFNYWCIPYTFIDTDRREMGDYYKKPTQYWFIGCQPKYNFIFEGVNFKPTKIVAHQNKVVRSLISSDYANRFIREFII